MSDDGVIDGYKTTERDREWLGRGIRLGLEAAAKWHDDRRDENDTVSDNSAEGKLVRVNARVWANEHDRMATAIRAITPSDVLKK